MEGGATASWPGYFGRRDVARWLYPRSENAGDCMQIWVS
jgi:hypothetical protein